MNANKAIEQVKDQHNRITLKTTYKINTLPLEAKRRELAAEWHPAPQDPRTNH